MENGYFCILYRVRILGKQQQHLTPSSAFGQHSIMVVLQCRQSSKMQQCNLEQSLQEVRTSGRQRYRAVKEESPFGKGQHALFSLYVKPAEENHDFISSYLSIHANSIVQLGPLSLFKQSSLTTIMSACSISFPRVVIGQA